MLRLRWLILVLVAFFFFALACDVEDTAEDVAKDQVDTSFDKDVEFQLEPIEASGGEGTQTLDMDCGTTSVQEQLDENDIQEDDVDIDSIDLNFVAARYLDATWTPEEVTHMSCVLTLNGDAGSAMVVDANVEKGSSEWVNIDVPQEAVDFINYYLDHRSEQFDYCVECSDADTYSVTWEVSIGVTVKGEIL